MDPAVTWTTWPWVIRLRRSHPIVDIGAETADGFRRHLSMRNAAVLTYYGFISVFPLFMVASAILALVLRNNQRLQEEILTTAVAQFPVIGTQIREQSGSLQGSVVAVVVGLIVTLWAATRAFVGVQSAFDDAWEVPLDDRANLAVTRAKALAGVAILGTGIVVATVVSSLAGATNLPGVSRVALAMATVAINISVVIVMIRTLTAASVTWRMALPGAVVAGIGFGALQIAGAAIVSRYLASASDTSGAFATVFALLGWLNLHAIISIAAVELNAALHRRDQRLTDIKN
jgi:membrane protein